MTISLILFTILSIIHRATTPSTAAQQAQKLVKYLKEQFKTVNKTYRDLAIDTDKELEGINRYQDQLEREVQQLTKNFTNYENIRDTVKDLTRRHNIVYYQLKRAELAKSSKIRRMVFQIQQLTENTGTLITHFLGIRKELTTIKEDQQNILSQIQLIETQSKFIQDLLAKIDTKTQSLVKKQQKIQTQVTKLIMEANKYTTILDNIERQ